ncbi:GNAT family N-acetyltransferase [Clostridium sp. 'deep sea']|uniref:GNAT family N-acetyltransferase n=1 Tax=Clostridium sp. 'deep sea' TaxID=2779445 RepID=UPI00189667A1|nr:GNAT family N-acetyltransferase [Clostridium sp. 'deep sea']QOR36173.1 GNAT family N-acetyltransferase [Clostridium sp. 'deep sea']
MEFSLKKLSANDGIKIYNMLQDIAKNENGFMNTINGVSYDVYKNWLIKKEQEALLTELKKGWKVPSTIYWLYINDIPVGMGKLRHFLTPKLEEEGGHIGYAIRKSERNKGYGTVLLKHLLKEAKNMNIEKVLITVQNHNKHSIKIGLNNNGKIVKQNDIRTYISIES